MGMQGDPLARIEDPTVRRFVRVVVHVRRFLPFYATGLLFAVTMAVVPAMDGGGGNPSSLAGPGGGAGSAAGFVRPTGTGSGGAAAAGPARAGGVAGASSATFADVGLDGAIDGADLAAAPLTSPTGALADARGGSSPTAGLPSGAPAFDTPAEFPETPRPPEPCKLTPPSPAPAVDPARELTSGQDTVEAVAGQALPADAGETVDPVSQEALCNVPESPVPVPDVPLPAAPVSEDAGPGLPLHLGWLLQLAFLF